MSTTKRILTRLAALAVATAGASLALPQGDAHAASGTTYYVSPSGNDANSGTSPTAAIRSLSRASGLQLNPGDELLFQRGGTFSGKLAVWRNGSAGAPITIGSYGSGVKPVISGDCLEIGGSYVTMTDFTVADCTTNGIWTNGTGNVITNVEATRNVQGIDVGPQAKGTKVVRNHLHHNQRMAPNTPGPVDDWGAVGMVVEGDNTEVAYNLITDNWGYSDDFDTDGSAIEIYGGIGTVVHHNTSVNNRMFSELGNPRSANTTYAYNQVTSDLIWTDFILVHGGGADLWGPVLGTVAVNNSVKFTSKGSQGYMCFGVCSPQNFVLKNNVLDVAGRIGNIESGSVGGGNNVYWRGTMNGISLLPGDKYADPQFRDGDLVPGPRSPLVDTGTKPPMDTDLNGNVVGVDGNGDGLKGADIGAHEAGSKKAKKCGKAKGKGGKAKGRGGKGSKAGKGGKDDRADAKKSKCGKAGKGKSGKNGKGKGGKGGKGSKGKHGGGKGKQHGRLS